MNHDTTPTKESRQADDWFQTYLLKKCVFNNQSCRLARAIGVERKTIYRYAYGQSSPKLETMAKILAYYGDFDKIAKAVGGLDLIKEEKHGTQ